MNYNYLYNYSFMGSMAIIFFLQHVFIFCLIFWLLTWMAEYFFKKKNTKTKYQFYECGFKTISELNVQININFSIVCVFLILYDVEFIFLYPIFFNFFFLNYTIIFSLIFFLSIIIYALVYDLIQNSLSITI